MADRPGRRKPAVSTWVDPLQRRAPHVPHVHAVALHPVRDTAGGGDSLGRERAEGVSRPVIAPADVQAVGYDCAALNVALAPGTRLGVREK